MKDVFISYSRTNTKEAQNLAAILEQNGISSWIDFEDITYGTEYAAGIIKGIRECKCFVVLLSERSGNSRHVLSEINSAVNYRKQIFSIIMENFDISDTLQYYLGCYQWFDASQKGKEDLNKLINAIKLTLNVTFSDPKPAAAPTLPQKQYSPKSGSRMVMFEEMLALGYTAKTIATQLVENDYLNYEGISDSNEGFADQWAPFIEGSSETFQYMLDGENRIIGDWSIVAIDEEMREAALKGELLEENIHFDNTVPICFPGIYHGYILTLEILPNYRNQHNYKMLMDSFIAQLVRYAEDGIFFKDFVINLFTPSVDRLVKSLGFTYKCNNICLGKIYSLTLLSDDAAKLFKLYPELGVLYSHAED